MIRIIVVSFTIFLPWTVEESTSIVAAQKSLKLTRSVVVYHAGMNIQNSPANLTIGRMRVHKFDGT
jgi:hypothetical protein